MRSFAFHKKTAGLDATTHEKAIREDDNIYRRQKTEDKKRQTEGQDEHLGTPPQWEQRGRRHYRHTTKTKSKDRAINFSDKDLELFKRGIK